MKTQVEKQELEQNSLVPSTENSQMVAVADQFNGDLANTVERLDLASIPALKTTRSIADAMYWAPYDNGGLTVEKDIRDFLGKAQEKFDAAQAKGDKEDMEDIFFNKLQKYRRYVTYLGAIPIKAVFDNKESMVKHVFFVDLFTGEMLKAAQKELVSKLTATVTLPTGETVSEFASGSKLCITYLGKVTKKLTYNHYEVSKLEIPA